MTKSSEQTPGNWIVHATEKLVAKEWLAVFISGAAFVVNAMLTVLSVSLALFAIYLLYAANEQIAILEIRIDKLENHHDG